MGNRIEKPQEDQRVRLTKTMLKSSFLELLGSKSIQNITVKELCERAGVNRGTFYLHFYDLYDLLEQMENDMLADLQQVLNENPVIRGDVSQEAAATFISSLFRFVEKNRELCAILLGDNGDKKFVNRLIEVGREKSVREYRALFQDASVQQVEIFYAFIASGFLGVIEYGLQHPSLPFEPLVAAAERIVAEGSRYLGK